MAVTSAVYIGFFNSLLRQNVNERRLNKMQTLNDLGVVLRPCDATYDGFLQKLSRGFHASMIDLSYLPEAQRAAMLDSQFRIQTQYYKTEFLSATSWIIEQAGIPIGRLYLDRSQTPWRLLDILLLPEAQNQGIGRALLGWVQEGADSVALHVAINNPRAEALYRALGFAVVREEGMYRYMVWQRG
jgi:ribosomal protein S18 acetylase RimI-like enzyme